MHTYSDEQVAQVCHEANRALQDITGDPSPSPMWFTEDPDIRRAAAEGVRLARSGCTPRELHDRWVQDREAHGWVYGEDKDPYRKTHPCLRPYDDLPAGQKIKDRLFIAIVTALTLET